MMRTKCLECERCTERRESFQDVSVPLKAEGSVDSDSEPGWFHSNINSDNEVGLMIITRLV